MAKIKLKGYKEAIYTDDDTAKRIIELVLNENIPLNQKIKIRGMLISKSDIKSVFLDELYNREEQATSRLLKQQEEYYKRREEEIFASPEQKAQQQWQAFVFFYRCITQNWGKGVVPDEKYKEIVYQKSLEFFQKNKYRTRPDIEVFVEVLDDSFNKQEILEQIKRNPGGHQYLSLLLKTIENDKKEVKEMIEKSFRGNYGADNQNSSTASSSSDFDRLMGSI